MTLFDENELPHEVITLPSGEIVEIRKFGWIFLRVRVYRMRESKRRRPHKQQSSAMTGNGAARGLTGDHFAICEWDFEKKAR